MRVSIIIKALNEEANIDRAIRSSIAAIKEVSGDGEVILADSLSSDRTVQIASRLGIRVVQLVDPDDRSCGIGAQLGYSVASGEFLYILDGDMEFLPGFLPIAVKALEEDASLAGVAGTVEDVIVTNMEFKRRSRKMKGAPNTPSADPVCLNMGGLYRRSAIEDVGYFTHRNLHAYEEFELGVRLRHAGWRLERLNHQSIRHYGPPLATLPLLLRRLKSKHTDAHGELFRLSFGKAYFFKTLVELRDYRIQALTVALWLLVIVIALVTDAGLIETIALVFITWFLVAVMLAIRKRSFPSAIFSVALWHLGIIGFLRGLIRLRPVNPSSPIHLRLIQ